MQNLKKKLDNSLKFNLDSDISDVHAIVSMLCKYMPITITPKYFKDIVTM